MRKDTSQYIVVPAALAAYGCSLTIADRRVFRDPLAG